MKRCAALRDLSSEHHHGLALAKRVQEALGTALEKEVWSGVRVRFASEVEPHFLAEERGLLPLLERAGETGLVRRTLDDHAELRRLIGMEDVQAMRQFPGLLTQHIRFEERELFEIAQLKLSGAELDDLAARLAAIYAEYKGE